MGGPVIQNKMFFFGGYQETTVRAAPTESFGYVPTPDMMAGDFTTVTSPACAGKQINLAFPFVNNKILPTAFSAPALALQKRLPATSDPCGKVYFAKINKSNEYLVPARVDYQVNDKHSLFGRFNFSRLDQASQYDGKNILTLDAGPSPLRVYQFVLGDTYLVGPGTVSSFRGSVNRTNIVKQPPAFPDLGEFGVKAYIYQPATLRVTVTNGFTAGTNNGTFSQYNTTAFQFAEDISMIRGKHQIGFGGSWIHQQLNALSMVFATAPITFNGTNGGQGLGLVDFLLGKPSSFQQGSPGLFYYRLNFAGLYVQDSWKITPRLTLNPGLRWEPYLPVYVDDVGLSYFDRGAFDAGIKSTVFPNAPAGLKFPGDPGMPGGRRVGFHRMAQIAPRFGLAWDPDGKGKTSVRAAYGIFYNRPNLTTYGGYSSSAPDGNSVTVQNPQSFADPWGTFPGGDPFPVNVTKNFTFPLAGAYYAFTPYAKPTYQNQWNLSVQREVASNLLVSAAYIGTNIIHMWTGGALNPAVYISGNCGPGQYGLTVAGPCSSLTNIQARRALNLANPREGQYYGTISGLDDGGTGNYHGMLLSVQRRTAKGLTVSGNYTLSHCIADIVKTSQTAQEYVIPGDRSSSRGNCGSDRRHAFNSSVVYQTPSFSNPAAKMLFSNWQVSAIVKLMAGQYFDILAGTDRALTGAPAQRGNQLLADVYAPNKSASQWLNPLLAPAAGAAFAIPANGTYGTMAAANIRGPRSAQIDMGLTRSFQVREHQSIQFRMEAFNVPNLVNLQNPVNSLNSLNFGKILSSADPRIMQAALKYVF
jgi:hypothetical protein